MHKAQNLMKSNKTETIIVRVDRQSKQALRSLAKLSRRELSDYMRLIIEDAIKNKTKV
jgi:hypothetical protein